MKKCVKCGTQISNDDYLCVSCLMNELSKKISGSSDIDIDESNPFRGTAFDSTDILDAFGAPIFKESNAFNITKSSLLSNHDVTDSDDINGNKYSTDQLDELFGVSKGNDYQHKSNNAPQDNDVSVNSADDLFGEKNTANEKITPMKTAFNDPPKA